MLQSMRASAKYVWVIIVVLFVGGFLLVETSGLLGRAAITPSTPVAEVNGEEIPYQAWINLTQSLSQQQEQQLGRGLSLDERREIEDQAFNQLVSDVLLRQEFAKRDISVNDAEIIEAAQFMPPPQLAQSPELQTEGRFDIDKYRRFLASPAARTGGLLAQLEQYYRSEIPRQKLVTQIAQGVFVTDERLWRNWKDTHDSAQVTFVALSPDSVPDAGAQVTDAELRAYYDKHAKRFDRPGRAVVSLVEIPRTITAADTAATRARIVALRDEIAKGAKFEEVAQRESADTISGSQGGDLGRGGRNRFVKPFEDAAYALAPGQVSEPVLTNFGYHLIRVDDKKGDTLALRHILLRIQQSDSTASRTDRRADSLSKLAGSADDPKKFDAAAKSLGLTPKTAVVTEREPLILEGRVIPSVSAWAFGGAQLGESSELFDSDEGYFMARLDSLREGGQQSFEAAKDEVRRAVLREKRLEGLMPRAQQLATQAAGSTLEAAAQAQKLPARQSTMFTRVMAVEGIGRLNEAIGAAFALPVGAVSAPIKTPEAVVVLRVDRRVMSDSAAWAAQKLMQRQQLTQVLQETRGRTYLEGLRSQAKVEDFRKKLNATARRLES